MKNMTHLRNLASRGVLLLVFFAAMVPKGLAQFGPPPIVVVQPLAIRVQIGGTAVFSVVALSATSLQYKWYKGAQRIGGANSSILILNDVSANDAANYWVEVKNGSGTVDSQPASLAVVGIDSPVANPDGFTTVENQILQVPVAGVLANDLEPRNEPLLAAILSDVSNGSVVLNSNGSFEYTPPAGFSGTASFKYRAASSALLALEQSAIGGSKEGIKQGQEGSQSFRHGDTGQPNYMISKVVLRLSRESSAPNSDLIFSIGTSINGGAIGGSTVAIDSSSVTNTTAGSSFQTYEIAFDEPVGPFVSGTTYYLNLECGASNGKEFFLEKGANNYSRGSYYKHSTNQGVDIWFQVFGSTISSPATVTIQVAAINDPPVVTNEETNTLEDTSVVIGVLDNDFDPDGTPLTLLATSAENGSAVVDEGAILFTPAANFHGSALVTYTVSDGTNQVAGSATVTVVPVNDAPVAQDDSYSTTINVPLSIPANGLLANDTDVDNEPADLRAVLVTDVTDGTLVLSADGSFTYTPAGNFHGIDSFSYRGSDGIAPGSIATVSLIVNDPVPKFTGSGLTPEGFKLQMSVPIGRSYVILASTNLSHWEPIATNTSLTGVAEILDQSTTNRVRRFYQTVTQ